MMTGLRYVLWCLSVLGLVPGLVQSLQGQPRGEGTVPDHGEEWVSSGHRDYDYLEWIARLTSHIPDRGTHLVHYYGAYSNRARGQRRKAEEKLQGKPASDASEHAVPTPPERAALPAARGQWPIRASLRSI